MLSLILYLYLYHSAPKKFAWPVTCELYRYSTTIRPFSVHIRKRGTGFAVNPRRWCLYQLIFTAQLLYVNKII